MEAVAAKISDGAKGFSFIIGIHTLGRVFHYLQIMPSGNLHDRVHLAGYSCIMDRNDRTGLICDRLFDQLLVNIHGIRSDIHKYDPCTAKHKCICR